MHEALFPPQGGGSGFGSVWLSKIKKYPLFIHFCQEKNTCFLQHRQIFFAICGILSFAEICAVILEQSMGTGNRVGIGLPYRPARLHMQAESNITAEILKNKRSLGVTH